MIGNGDVPVSMELAPDTTREELEVVFISSEFNSFFGAYLEKDHEPESSGYFLDSGNSFGGGTGIGFKEGAGYKFGYKFGSSFLSIGDGRGGCKNDTGMFGFWYLYESFILPRWSK
jgi:hypothetical protein